MTAAALPLKLGAREVTADLFGRLRRHYIKPGEVLPGGVFVTEVSRVGNGGRRADAIYAGFTSASGRRLVGHEVKATRSDWLAELAKTGKADTWADACHAWYVVAPDTDVVRLEELPPEWGLLVPGASTRTRMTVAKPAVVHPDREPPWWATLAVLAKADSARAGAVLDARQRAQDEARRDVEARVAEELARRGRQAPDVDALRARLAEVEGALGLRVVDGEGDRWRRDSIGLDQLRRLAPAIVAARDLERVTAELLTPWSTPVATARRLVEDLEAAIEAVRAAARAAGTPEEVDP